MDSELQVYINRIFSGDVPLVFKELMADIEYIFQPLNDFEKTHPKDVNLMTILLDANVHISNEIKQRWSTYTPEQLLTLKDAARHFWNCLYLESQNAPILPEDKHEILLRIRKMVNDLTFLNRGIEIMDDQPSFLQRLKEDEKNLKKEMKKWSNYQLIPIPVSSNIGEDKGGMQTEMVNSSDIDKANVEVSFYGDLNPIWKFGNSRLLSLSEALTEMEFTDKDAPFWMIFQISSKTKCKWLKTKTSLLFLLGNVFAMNDSLTDSLVNLICNKVEFHGKATNRNTILTQLAQMKNIFSSRPNELKGQYAEIFDLIQTSFPNY